MRTPYDPAESILIEYRIDELNRELDELSQEKQDMEAALIDARNAKPEIVVELERRIESMNRRLTKARNQALAAKADLFLHRRKNKRPDG